jgi:hypothetical protein
LVLIASDNEIKVENKAFTTADRFRCFNSSKLNEMVAIWLPLGLLASIVALFLYYTTRTFSHWKDKGVPSVKTYPLVGSFWTLVTLQEHMSDYFGRLYKKFKSQKITGYFQVLFTISFNSS